jgi:hypothetical protein
MPEKPTKWRINVHGIAESNNCYQLSKIFTWEDGRETKIFSLRSIWILSPLSMS